MVYTAIMGHGTVGSGVAEILIDHTKRIEHKIKDEISVKYILDLRDFDNLSYSNKFTKDFSVIENDESIKIVIETMGGTNPAYDFVKRCLLKGKSVVTSNKELVAAHGAELLKIAKEKNVNFLFEASVGGGIPILRPIEQCLSANKIEKITGILNGTTNYILDKMIVDNMDFDVALKLAQDNGFAEKNPAADIEGHDACRKICILASLGFGKHIYPEQIPTEGITNITLEDIDYASSLGYVIKLIASAERIDDDKITAGVRPTLVPKDNILSSVNGVFNAIMVSGDQVGDVMFYGKGAGKNATASAVVADVVDCARHFKARKYLFWEDSDKDTVVKSNEDIKLYVYAKSADFKKLKESFESLFPESTAITNEFKGEIAFITHKDSEESLLNQLSNLSADFIKTMHILN